MDKIFELSDRLFPDQKVEFRNGIKTICRRRASKIKSNINHLPTRSDSVFLITYGDSLLQIGKSPMQTLNDFLHERVQGLITDVHLLPMYPYTSDDGFSVSDYYKVDKSVGSWKDVQNIGRDFGLMFDAVINHSSVQNPWFRRFLRGRKGYRRFYIEEDENFDCSKVVRPRISPLFHTYKNGKIVKRVWTTFSEDQVDINFADVNAFLKISDVLAYYMQRSADTIRMDAIGFIAKKSGTSCMNLQQTHLYIRLLKRILKYLNPNVRLIAEVNVPQKENFSYFGTGDEADLVYQFTLPPLMLYTLLYKNAEKFNEWLRDLCEYPLPKGCSYFNFLASHDGIGLRPLEGICGQEEIECLVVDIVKRGGRVGYRQTPDGKKPYELNINYFSALYDEDERIWVNRFVAAHAVLLFMKGTPAIYIHSLIGSQNWEEGVSRSGINRRINREKNNKIDLDKELDDSNSLRSKIFGALCNLIKIKHTYSVFDIESSMYFLESGDGIISFRRENSTETADIYVNVTLNPIQLKNIGAGMDLLTGIVFSETMQMEAYQTVCLFKKK